MSYILWYMLSQNQIHTFGNNLRTLATVLLLEVNILVNILFFICWFLRVHLYNSEINLFFVVERYNQCVHLQCECWVSKLWKWMCYCTRIVTVNVGVSIEKKLPLGKIGKLRFLNFNKPVFLERKLKFTTISNKIYWNINTLIEI